MGKKLSVIIVSYQAVELLRDCLNSIEKYNDIGDGLEVIVSDNSPDMRLFDDISRDYPSVKLVKNENIGFGAGNNRGFEHSTGEYLLFLNPDTKLVEPIFAFAVEKFEKDKDLAMFGIQQTDKEGNFTDSFGILGLCGPKNIFGYFQLRRCRKKGKFEDGRMYPDGADLFVRRSSFLQAGKFDEKIFMYYEEEDLTRRIKLYSEAKKTAFFGEKKLIHLGGGTGERNEASYLRGLRRGLDSMKYCAEKYSLDFEKLKKVKYRHARMKYRLARLRRKRDKAEFYRKVMKIYRDEAPEGRGS